MAGVTPNLSVFQFNNNGSPMVNGTLTTYLTGTSTLSPTWQDSALTILNTNPITLNSRGEATIWLDSTISYRFVLKDSTGTVQWTKDNIAGSPSGLNLQGISASGINSYTGSAAMPVTDFGDLAVYTGVANGTLTLPDVALGSPGNSVISIYNASANLLTVARQGSTALINVGGAATSSIVLKKGETIQLLDNGTDWVQVDYSSVLGCAKAWCNFDGTLAGPAITPRSGFNISAISKTGTGAYTATLSTAMADTNYIVVGTCSGTSGASFQMGVASSATSFTMLTRQNATALDVSVVSFVVFGV